MKLCQIMTKQVITVGVYDRILSIQSLFEKHNFHHLLVVDEAGLLAGIVSDRDLLKTISPFISTLVERPVDLQTLERRAHQIMSRNPVTASPDDTIRRAALLMLNKKISCLPIISPNGKIEGIVTWKDILKWLVEQTNETIS